MFLLCVTLHLVCVSFSGFHYRIMDALRHFNLSDAVGIASGLGSVVTAVVMGQYYLLRNKLLRHDLKKKKAEQDRELEAGEEQKDN